MIPVEKKSDGRTHRRIRDQFRSFRGLKSVARIFYPLLARILHDFFFARKWLFERFQPYVYGRTTPFNSHPYFGNGVEPFTAQYAIRILLDHQLYGSE